MEPASPPPTDPTATPRRVVVHGATGVQGGAIVRALGAAGHEVVAVSRGGVAVPGTAASVAADLGDVAALVDAYRAAHAVVVQLPLRFDTDAVRQAECVLDALARAEVPRAVFNAGGPILPFATGVPYLDARWTMRERLADAVDLAATVGPVGAYLENLAIGTSARRIRDGEVAYPLPPDVPMPWLALDDLAGFVADAVVADRPAALRVVAGPEALTGPELAERLGEGIGSPLRWRTITAAEYESMLVPHIGAEAAAGIAGFYARADAEMPAPDPTTLATGSTTAMGWARRVDWSAAAAT